MIHDAARPVVDSRVIDRVLGALDDLPGAIPALAVSDTLKRGAHDRIEGTVDRAGLWRAQTPQGFRYNDILEAHRAARGQALTDDAAVAEAVATTTKHPAEAPAAPVVEAHLASPSRSPQQTLTLSPPTPNSTSKIS